MSIKEMIVIDARNQTRRAFNEFSTAGKKAADDVQGAFESLEGVMMATGTALTAVAVAGGAFLISSTMLAARVETLGIVVQRLGENAGYTKEQLDAVEQSIINQGITAKSTLESMALLMQANIDLSNASKLARLAQDAAVIAGINSSDAFNRIATAVSQLNPRMLRSMGILISLETEYKKFADLNNVTVDSLDDLTQQQIMLNAIFEEGTAITGAYTAAMGTAGKKITSMPRLIEDMRVAFGDALLPAMTAVIDAGSDMLKWFNNLDSSMQSTISILAVLGVGFTGVTGGMLLLLSKLPALVGGLAALGTTSTLVVTSFAATGTATGKLALSMIGLAPAIAGVATALAALVVIGSVVGAVAMVIKTIRDVKGYQDEVTASLVEHEAEIVKTTGSWEAYVDEMVRVLDLTGRLGGLSPEMAKTLVMRAGDLEVLRKYNPELLKYLDLIEKLSFVIQTGGQPEGIVLPTFKTPQVPDALKTLIPPVIQDFVLSKGFLDDFTELNRTTIATLPQLQKYQSQVGNILEMYKAGKLTVSAADTAFGDLADTINDANFTEKQAASFEALREWASGTGQAAASSALYEEEMARLALTIEGPVSQALDDYANQMENIRNQQDLVREQISEIESKGRDQGWLGASDREKLANYGEEFTNLGNAAETTAAQFEENTKHLLYNAAAAQINASALSDEKKMEGLQTLAEELGFIDENTANVFEVLRGIIGQFTAGDEAAGDMAGQVSNLVTTIGLLPEDTDLTVTTHFLTTGLQAQYGFTVPVPEEQSGRKPPPDPKGNRFGGDYLVTSKTLFSASETGKTERVTFKPLAFGEDGDEDKGGDTFIININDRMAAAYVMAEIDSKKRGRLSDTMGG